MGEARAGAGGTPVIGVGMVGYAFMGAAHSQGWRTVGRVFGLPVRPVMAAICGRDGGAARAAADRLGWAAVETDWRALIERDDVQLVDIAAPGDLHAPIAIAALRAGKHVLCEKPLANTVAEAEAMAAAEVAAAGQVAMVGFNYRRVPAIALARRLVEQGRIGTLRHVRASYLQDWLADPAFPLTWRLQAEHAGSGALGDLGAHLVDLAQYLAGELITGVSGVSTTFTGRRPLPGGHGHGEVTVDDAVLVTARLGSGALASLEATRFATGRKNALRIELNGSAGSLAFDLERLNELEFCDAAEAGSTPLSPPERSPTPLSPPERSPTALSPPERCPTAGFRRILVTEPGHPYLSAWWPPGHTLGWEHTFSHQFRDLLLAISGGTRPAPSFADGLQVQRVLAAAAASAAGGSAWTPVPQPAPQPVSPPD